MFNPEKNFIKQPQKESDTESQEDKFDHLMEQLTELGIPEKYLSIEDDLLDAVYKEKTITLSDACKKLSEILTNRKKALAYLRADILPNTNEVEASIRLHLVQSIDSSTCDQRLFLGSGNIARVYKLENHPGICVKKIINYHGYQKENSVSQEAAFMNRLSDFEVNDVRTPHIIDTISGGGLTTIIMEELDAVNFELAASGKAPIPRNFNLDLYFQKLTKYITKMHEEKGIAHKDLAPRNIMICNKTGNPFVIDFGRSEYLSNAKNVDLSCKKDFAGIETSKALMKNFLKHNTQ